MIEDGLMDRFGIEEVFGMHNYPGMPVGAFGIRPGPMMAAADALTIDIEGVGAHAARPHLGVDTVLVGAQIINALQSVVSRNVDPLKSAVVSICMFRAGNTDNVIPQTVQLREPGGTPAGERIRDLLKDPALELTAGSELLLFNAARAQLAAEVIEPARERGLDVVCDRYVDSTVAYQGVARGLGIELVEQLNSLVVGECVPDLTLLLRVDPNALQMEGSVG